MTLLTILIGLGLEYFLGSLDRLRNYTWFDQYGSWLELRCSKLPQWDGPAGVLITLGIPLLVLALVINLANGVSVAVSLILAIVVFIYSIGSDVNSLLDDYIEALSAGDAGSVQGIEHQLGLLDEAEKANSMKFVRLILVQAHDHIFGVIFWFIVLGPVGALLYSLTVRMKHKFSGVHGNFAEAVDNLHGVLVWPSARLLALGFALAGSLVDALEAWRNITGQTLEISERIICECGTGAIQFREAEAETEQDARAVLANHVQETQALINRTLIVWLTILGLMTLSEILN